MSDSAIINAPIPTAQSLCPLCHEIFLDPRILPCLHTLCLSCLNRLRPFTSTRNGSETQKSLLCPVCDSEVVLPPEGVTGLVPDMVAEEEVLREMLRSSAHEPPCDLCGEGRAQNRCQDCKVNVCEFCCQAHRRQTRTARHHLLPMQDLPPGLSLTPVPLCTVHLLEELRLFCEPCSVPACRDCALTRHQGHAVRPVAEVAGRHREDVQKAVMEVEAQLTELEAAMKGVHSVKEALNRRAELLREEVEAFTDKYISAVHEHRSRLLRDIDEEIQRRQQTLSLQGARIQQQISDLSTATSFTKGLLERAPDVHLARTQSLVLNRLQGLRHGDLKMEEMEEATGIQFSPQEEAGLCQGYRMYGGVTGRGVDPERSEVRGVRSARVGEPSGFTLTCNDASGESMGHGGQQPRVTILYKGSERSLQSSIQDRHDGSYRVSYTPPAPGELALSALLKGRHIRGSPFTVTVTDASHQHRGIYHCCSFCSSGGQKDARCACGGTMPGGYQGCGHGHKGHPGRPHWSCCGGTTEKSECQSMKKVVPRNLLRTVAL